MYSDYPSVFWCVTCRVMLALFYYDLRKKSTSVFCKSSLTQLSSTGFVDLQTEKADLMENVGTIPFLDYKHFAARIFFPQVPQSCNCSFVLMCCVEWWKKIQQTYILFCFQNESLMTSCVKDIGQVRFVACCCCWCWCHTSLWLSQWSAVVSDLKSGCSAGSAGQELPGVVKSAAGPAVPNTHGACAGGTEEL